MSYDNYGYDEPNAGQPEPGRDQGPKWFRDYMDKVSGQLSELRAENEALKQAQVRTQVVDTLKAKGYAPEAASLFSGEPEKLDDWLSTHGAALAKLSPEGEQQALGQPQAPTGPPASAIPPDVQAQMQQMAEAGTQGVVAPQGTDSELAAQIAASSPEEFQQLMSQHGNRFGWT